MRFGFIQTKQKKASQRSPPVFDHSAQATHLIHLHKTTYPFCILSLRQYKNLYSKFNSAQQNTSSSFSSSRSQPNPPTCDGFRLSAEAGSWVFGYQQLYCMEEAKKGSSFLDKFRGRTNRIDKSGLNHALINDRLTHQDEVKEENSSKLRPKKLASLDTRDLALNHTPKKDSIEELLATNPERKHLRPILTKRSTDATIRPNKVQPVNLTAIQTLREVKQSLGAGLQLPPSRSISDKGETYHRRSFGKYLKLDDEAMRHFQFLLQMDKKKVERENSVVVTGR